MQRVTEVCQLLFPLMQELYAVLILAQMLYRGYVRQGSKTANSQNTGRADHVYHAAQVSGHLAN